MSRPHVVKLNPYPTIGDVVKALTSVMEKSGPDTKFFIDGLGPNSPNIEDVRLFTNRLGQPETCMVVYKGE